MKYCVIILFGLAVQLDAYLILQMRKSDASNQSDGEVDTLPHKSGGKSLQEESGSDPKRNNRRSDYGLKLDMGQQSDTGIGRIIRMLSEAYDSYFGEPQGRSGSDQSNDGSQSKRSLALELESESILRRVESFLASPKVKSAAAEIARKAAVVYKAIESEL